MLDVRDWHHLAMAAAERAFLRQHAGTVPEGGDPAYVVALACERMAAEAVPEGVEPTRSVLHRSAACLAVHAGEPEEALRLADAGLRSNVPRAIEVELWDVVAHVLKARGQRRVR